MIYSFIRYFKINFQQNYFLKPNYSMGIYLIYKSFLLYEDSLLNLKNQMFFSYFKEIYDVIFKDYLYLYLY